MTASSAGDRGASGLPGRTWQDATPAEEHSPDRGLLEEVVRRTLADSAGAPEADVALVECLRKTASRHRGRALVLDPVVFDLVETVLRRQFDADGRWAESWRALSRQIGGTLYDDPVCRERLEQFWTRLNQA